jgi:hypothetical protein
MKTFSATDNATNSKLDVTAISDEVDDATTDISPKDTARLAEATQSPEREGKPTKPKMKTNPFHLQFSPRTRVYLIPTLDEYTDEEINNTWITKEEEIVSQRDLIKTIEILRQNNGAIPKNLQDICAARGIDHIANQQEAARRKALKMSHIDAVLDAQDDFCSPKEIAKISKATSKAARKRAQLLGASDEQELA